MGMIRLFSLSSLPCVALPVAAQVLVPRLALAETAAASQTPAPAFLPGFAEATEAAAALRLHADPGWHRILFQQRNRFGRLQPSLISSPEYFLATNGARDPQLELHATIKALFAAEGKAACTHPLRADWIGRQLARKGVALPQRACPDLANYLGLVQARGATLVFSSAYPNGPSSMFGHTFLRLDSDKGTGSAARLNDMSVGFAANPDTANPIAYAWKGLAGGFPGKFDVMPFYVKVQEYMNAEARDLWEYQLALSRQEVERIALAVWEYKAISIPYYYHHDNCAWILLALIDIAKEEAILLSKPYAWVLPADTVRHVVETPGLVQGVSFRPSVYRTLRQRLASQDPLESASFRKVLSEENLASVLAFEPGKQAIVFDDLLDFFDYDERLAGTKESVRWASLRKEVLTRRARLGSGPKLAAVSPGSREAPQFAHGSGRIAGEAFVTSAGEPRVALVWRPVLHDFRSHNDGYGVHSEVEFLSARASVSLSNGRPHLDALTLLGVASVNPYQVPYLERSWQLSFAWDASPLSSERRGFAKGGVGAATSLFSSDVIAFGFGTLIAGRSNRLGWFLEPGVQIGTRWTLGGRTSVLVRYDLGLGLGTRARGKRSQADAVATLAFGQDADFQLFAASRGRTYALGIGLSKYF